MRPTFVALCLSLMLPGCKSKDSSPDVASSEPPPSPPSATASAEKQGVMLRTIQAPPDVATPPADAEKTATGLVSKVVTPGTGTDHPRKQDGVKVNYTGWTKDGQMFDSSVARGEPASFGLERVIPGWTEGLQLMVTGEKRRFWIPAALAYGQNPRAGAPAGDLTFDVELLDIMKGPDLPAVPEDVAAPPKTAKKTKSGLAYKVLKPGTGNKPKATDVVSVHYSGWTTDGRMFDSSVMRKMPFVTRLDQVVKGWTEGVQLMKVGEKTRFWIPADLAYGDKPTRPGAPSGMLVFDIELLEIKTVSGVPAHS